MWAVLEPVGMEEAPAMAVEISAVGMVAAWEEVASMVAAWEAACMVIELKDVVLGVKVMDAQLVALVVEGVVQVMELWHM